MSITWWNCGLGVATSLDTLGPGHRHRLARAAEVGALQLGALVRRAARPGPAGVVHVVGLRAAQCVQAAQLFERLQVLSNGGRDAVLCQLLADGAVQAFRGRPVVAPDVEDQRVVQPSLARDLVDDLAGIGVRMFGEAGEDLHQPALERLLGVRDRVPRGHRRRPRRELGVLRNPALGLGAGEGAFAISVPSVVELALVLVGPLLHHLVRAVRCARRPVHEEGLVRRVGLLLAQPVDRILGNVLAEVVALLRVHHHRAGVACQRGLVLRRLTRQEAIEVLEPIARGPVLERPLAGDLFFRRVVPLAPGAGVVAVVLQHFGHSGGRLGNDSAEAVEVVGDGRDLAVADEGVVAPGEQRGARRRAHRGGVKAVVGHPHLGDPVKRGRVDLAAIRGRRARAHVVHQDDQDVGRAVCQALGLDALLVGRRLDRQTRLRARGRGRERQDFLSPAGCGEGHGQDRGAK